MQRVAKHTIASVCVLMGASAGADLAAEAGFADLRASYQFVANDDYDDSSRISVMLIGPLCSILPVGCETPARLADLDDDAPSSSDAYDSGYLTDAELASATSSLDPLFSIEAAQTFYEDEDFDAEVTTTGINIGAALGWEIGCCGRSRWQIEAGIYGGFGLSTHDDSVNEDENVFYFDYGLRLGTHFTFPMGIQVGFDYRFEDIDFEDADELPFQIAPEESSTFGVSVGWRF